VASTAVNRDPSRYVTRWDWITFPALRIASPWPVSPPHMLPSTRHVRSGGTALPVPLHSAGAGRRARIALVTEYYYPHLGGICEHVHFFAREARKRGHLVNIITSGMAGAAPVPGVVRVGQSVPVYMNASHARFTVGVSLRARVRRLLEQGEYDLVHVHSPLTPVLPLLAIDEARCPVVGTFHTYFDKSFWYATGGAYFQRRLDALAAPVTVSASTTRALRKYFNADWRTVPNGVDLDMFRPNLPPPPGMRTDVPVILFLGRFDPRNGLSLLIDAFKRVRAAGRAAQLVVVGDGPLRSHYMRQAGGHPDIHFAGAVLEGRPAYYANASIYACPTDRASFGITLLEAMACGAPIVCSDIEGFRDVARADREAVMVPTGNAAALAGAIVDVLDDDMLRERLSVTGRARARQFSWPSVTDQVFDVYESVLGWTPGARERVGA
jgi:phosphatidylinositol alpha-mannosyltransferase